MWRPTVIHPAPSRINNTESGSFYKYCRHIRGRVLRATSSRRRFRGGPARAPKQPSVTGSRHAHVPRIRETPFTRRDFSVCVYVCAFVVVLFVVWRVVPVLALYHSDVLCPRSDRSSTPLTFEISHIQSFRNQKHFPSASRSYRSLKGVTIFRGVGSFSHILHTFLCN